MNPEHLRIVKSTWRRLEPIADVAARLFYERLFDVNPELKPLFHPVDMRRQQDNLVRAIDHVVQHLDHPDRLLPDVAGLGRRHRTYGVTDAHYEAVGNALLWTLQQGLSKTWTPEVEDAWIAAYGLLSGVMRDAANGGAAPTAA